MSFRNADSTRMPSEYGLLLPKHNTNHQISNGYFIGNYTICTKYRWLSYTLRLLQTTRNPIAAPIRCLISFSPAWLAPSHFRSLSSSRAASAHAHRTSSVCITFPRVGRRTPSPAAAVQPSRERDNLLRQQRSSASYTAADKVSVVRHYVDVLSSDEHLGVAMTVVV